MGPGEIFSSHCWFDLIQISTVAAVSEKTLNYGLPCLYSWSLLWVDNDTLSCNQGYGRTKEHFPLRVHQPLSLHALGLLMNRNFSSEQTRREPAFRSAAAHVRSQPCVELGQCHRAHCDLIWPLGQAHFPTWPLGESAAMTLENYWHFPRKWTYSSICCCRHTSWCKRRSHIFLLLLRSQLTHLENGCLCFEHNKHHEWCIN